MINPNFTIEVLGHGELSAYIGMPASVFEAPTDGKVYGRFNEVWTEVPTIGELEQAVETINQTISNEVAELNQTIASEVSTLENNIATEVNNAVEGIIGNAPTILDTLEEIATALGNDPNLATTLTNQINTKADATATTQALATKADATATTQALATKADATATTQALATKADATATTQALATKADATATTQALATKADATATTQALATKANIASPVFTGDPKAPTPATGDNDTSIATTAFVKNQGYLTQDSAEDIYLNQESADRVFLTKDSAGNTYLPLAGGTITGNIVAGDYKFGTSCISYSFLLGDNYYETFTLNRNGIVSTLGGGEDIFGLTKDSVYGHSGDTRYFGLSADGVGGSLNQGQEPKWNLGVNGASGSGGSGDWSISSSGVDGGNDWFLNSKGLKFLDGTYQGSAFPRQSFDAQPVAIFSQYNYHLAGTAPFLLVEQPDVTNDELTIYSQRKPDGFTYITYKYTFWVNWNDVDDNYSPPLLIPQRTQKTIWSPEPLGVYRTSLYSNPDWNNLLDGEPAGSFVITQPFGGNGTDYTSVVSQNVAYYQPINNINIEGTEIVYSDGTRQSSAGLSNNILRNTYTPALQVTQTGTGNAFVVNDSSPDATPFVIDKDGHVGIGITPSSSVCLSVDSTGIKFGSGTTPQTVAFIPSLYATLASPTFTGSPSAPTASTSNNSTTIATTAFVKNQGYATTTSVALKANIASPTFTGTPLAPTATTGTNTTQIATTAFVQNAVTSLVNSSPATLDTLGELATALGNDPNFATTIATQIGTKADATATTQALATKADATATTQALATKLSISDASSNYYPLNSNPSGYLVSSALNDYATQSYVASLGYITSSALTPYLPISIAQSTFLTIASASSNYYPLNSNPSGYLTSVSLNGYAQLSGATYTGKVNIFTDVNTVPINIGAGKTAGLAGVAGDIWIEANNMHFRDAGGADKTVVNTNSTNTFVNSNTFNTSTNTNSSITINQTGNGGGLKITNTGSGDSLNVAGAVVINAVKILPTSVATPPVTSGNMSHSEYLKELLITINGVQYAIPLRVV